MFPLALPFQGNGKQVFTLQKWPGLVFNKYQGIFCPKVYLPPIFCISYPISSCIWYVDTGYILLLYCLVFIKASHSPYYYLYLGWFDWIKKHTGKTGAMSQWLRALGCSTRGHRFNSQHPHGILQLSVASGPEDLPPSHRRTCWQNANAGEIYKRKEKKSRVWVRQGFMYVDQAGLKLSK